MLSSNQVSSITSNLKYNDREIVAGTTISCGFKDLRYFSRTFKQETGMTPHAYRAAYTRDDPENGERDHE